MQIPKPSAEMAYLFRSLVPDAPGVQVKPMFGNLGAFVNGNMFAGLFGDAIGVRLTDPDSLAELRSLPGTGPFGPETRPMAGYVAVPGQWHPDDLAAWIETAFTQVSRLAPKPPKTSTKRD